MISLPCRLNTLRSLRACHHSHECSSASPPVLDPPITFGHRGARAHAPENTIEAFAARPASRCDRPGERRVVDRRRRPGARPRRRGRYAACGAARSPTSSAPISPSHIPTLADLVDACGTDYELSLDLKDPAAASIRSIEVLRDRDSADAAADVAVRPVGRPTARAARPAPGRPSDQLDAARTRHGGPRTAGGTPRPRRDRRDQHAPHRLERRAGRPVPPLRPVRLRLGHAARAPPPRRACGWASTPSTAIHVDVMRDALAAEVR